MPLAKGRDILCGLSGVGKRDFQKPLLDRQVAVIWARAGRLAPSGWRKESKRTSEGGGWDPWGEGTECHTKCRLLERFKHPCFRNKDPDLRGEWLEGTSQEAGDSVLPGGGGKGARCQDVAAAGSVVWGDRLGCGGAGEARDLLRP